LQKILFKQIVFTKALSKTSSWDWFL